MAISHTKDNYTLPRGSVYFAAVGQSEQYIGNTPGFSAESKVVSLEVKDSSGGLVVDVEAIPYAQSFEGKLQTDNISRANIDRWFAGRTLLPLTSPGSTSDQITVTRGAYYQLGTTAQNPLGRSNYTSISGVPNGMEYDLKQGRLHVPVDSVLANGAVFTISGSYAATGGRVAVPSGAVAVGSLRYVPEDAAGESPRIFIPRVQLICDGNIDFKGRDWMAVSFKFSALKAPSLELFYFS